MTQLAAKLQTMLSVRKDKGATAVEYGLMVALIAVVIILAVTFLGESLSEKFDDVASKINAA